MSLPNALLTYEFHLDFLPWSHFSDQYVVKQRPDLPASLPLVPHRFPLQLSRVDISVIVVLLLIDCVVDYHGRTWVFLRASHVQLENYAIVL